MQGVNSESFVIDNSVYQGTVLGPTLWNMFFSDVDDAARSTGGTERKFADDLSVFQTFERLNPVAECKTILDNCKQHVHKWGRTNRVSFDPSKEHIVILHPAEHHGTTFKLLGCPVDPDLRMHSVVDQILNKIRPKTTDILRTRAYYSIPDLILQFKVHIWAIIEAHLIGYLHAVTPLLDKIDGVQRRFLRELDVSPEQAYLEFNFAPPSLRRHIAALGLLHKRVLGKCHSSYNKLLPMWAERFSEPRGLGHSKQLYAHWVEITSYRSLWNRSIFALVDVYNDLPQHVVDAPSVSTLQNYINHIVRTRCQQSDAAWASSFSRRTGVDTD